MTKILYNQNNKEILDSILSNLPGVRLGKMFGYPAYYVKGKLFACIYEDGVGLKVPEKLAKELLEKDHIIHFQPMGKRKMREWVQINRAKSNDYIKDEEIFIASLKFVSLLVEKNGKE